MNGIRYILKMIIPFLSTIIIFHSIGVTQEYYSKGYYRLIRSDPNVPLVSAFDAYAFGKLYLSDKNFEFSYRNCLWYTGIGYWFDRNSDNAHFSLIVGLYPSVREAEEATLNRLNSSSIAMKESSILGKKIGDNSWFTTEGSSKGEIILAITFIRKNAVFTISNQKNYFDLLELANTIDDDIMTNASYITINQIISPPVINSVDLSKKELNIGESALITIYASDPGGYNFQYQGFPLNHFSGDPINVFRIGVSSDTSILSQLFQDGRDFGSHTIKCWVVNVNNLYSSISQTEVIFSSLRGE